MMSTIGPDNRSDLFYCLRTANTPAAFFVAKPAADIIDID
jgi:hypothetical protein